MAFPTPEEEGVIVAPEQQAPLEETPVVPETPPVEVVPSQEASVSEEPVAAPESPAFDVDPAVPEELVPQVQELVTVAFVDDVPTAVQKARDTGNASLLDALHATLSRPDVRDELVKRGKQPAV